ncbi:MAG: GGDEF domain-containing protein [Myxococcales bacterium]|nr:GGDEF domain-containing protein [Myxococcales bacterium]
MKPATPGTPIEEPHPHAGARARYRFAIAGVALALAAGLGTPALARALSHSWWLPFETTLIGVGFLVAFGFLLTGWVLGQRVDRLSDEARCDPVTKVGNRRHLEECLSHEVDRAARAKMPLSLLMIDVDNLKKLNDVGGHMTGDVALALVGDVLRETCRSRDVAARVGGAEFPILLPRTHASEARIVAERIRSAIAERRRALGAPISKLLTVSIGVCDLVAIDLPRPHQLFEAADRALYIAKQTGRDRVVVFERRPPMQPTTVIVLDERRRSRKRKTPTHHSSA